MDEDWKAGAHRGASNRLLKKGTPTVLPEFPHTKDRTLLNV